MFSVKLCYIYRGGHICSAITAFLIFGHIPTTNWLMITNLVSNTMFSGSRIPMEPFKIHFDQYYSGITHVYHGTTLYLTRRDVWENSWGMTLAMFQIWTYIFSNHSPISFLPSHTSKFLVVLSAATRQQLGVSTDFGGCHASACDLLSICLPQALCNAYTFFSNFMSHLHTYVNNQHRSSVYTPSSFCR